MSDTGTLGEPLALAGAALGSVARPPVRGFWRRALHHPSFALGGVLVAALMATALLSLVWTPWPPTDIDVPSKLKPPSAQHWLGTDSL